MRENGVTAPFCGAHYCKWGGGDCDEPRLDGGGSLCKGHTCVNLLCFKGKNGADSLLCKDHECKAPSCRWEKDKGDCCPHHGCREGPCDKEAVVDSYWCEKHQRCTEPGCTRVTKSDGDRVLERCEDRKFLPSSLLRPASVPRLPPSI